MQSELRGWLESAIESARSEASVKGWRAVEAQHVVSTLRLAGNDPRRQELLEAILEESKPPLPAGSEGLHYLLATPFRYPPRQYGSRFRSLADPGVLYAGIVRRTACAEMGYWRWRFASASEGLREIPAAPQTLFQVGARGPSIDLQAPPLSDRESLWTDPVHYDATQVMGRASREAGIELLLYRSVRDPEAGICVAVLHPAALRPRRPLGQETWHMTITRDGVVWQRERQRFVFQFA